MADPSNQTTPYTANMAISELTAYLVMGDPERSHVLADRVLCRLLTTLGYQDVVEAYEKVEKWYA